VLAGEEMLPVHSKRFNNVLRQAVHEVVNREMVSSCWMTNVLCVADTCKETLSGTRIMGYVQRFDVSRKF
jgi:hypothetical protein